MKYHLCKNGDRLPLLGLGTFLSSGDDVYDSIVEAVKIGYRHIDCAAIYGNEEIVGKALKFLFDSKIVTREDLWITSKLWNNAHKPEDVRPALEKTLADLRLSYLDLYLIHWPVAMVKTPHNPFEGSDFIDLKDLPFTSTWEAMVNIKEAGLAKHIGVSNFSIKKLKELAANSSTPVEVNQVEAHPYFQQNELLEYCNKHNIHLTAYRPLGMSYTPSSNIKGLLYDKTIEEIAKKHSCHPSQVVLSWGIQRGTSVIPKSVNPERIKTNFNSLDLQLESVDIARINALEKSVRSTTGDIFCPKGSPYCVSGIWDE